jgi:hypothetical protein
VLEAPLLPGGGRRAGGRAEQSDACLTNDAIRAVQALMRGNLEPSSPFGSPVARGSREAKVGPDRRAAHAVTAEIEHDARCCKRHLRGAAPQGRGPRDRDALGCLM